MNFAKEVLQSLKTLAKLRPASFTFERHEKSNGQKTYPRNGQNDNPIEYLILKKPYGGNGKLILDLSATAKSLSRIDRHLVDGEVGPGYLRAVGEKKPVGPAAVVEVDKISVAARTHPSPKLRSSPFWGDHAAIP